MEIFQQSPSNQLEIITDFHKMRQAILSLGMKADPYWHLGTRLLTQNMGGWPKHDLHQLSALYRGHTSENLFQGSLASLAVCISIYTNVRVCFHVRNISRLQFTQMQVRVSSPDQTRRSVFPTQLVMDKTLITKCYDIYNDEPSGKTSPNWFCSRWGPVAMRACHGIVPSGSTLVLV